MTESKSSIKQELLQSKTLSGVLRSDSFFYTDLGNSTNTNMVNNLHLGTATNFQDYQQLFVTVKSPFFSIVNKNFLSEHENSIEKNYNVDIITSLDESYCLYRKPNVIDLNERLELRHFVTVIDRYFDDKEEIWFSYFDENHLHIFVKKNGQLKYYNEFYFTTEKDTLYYIKLVEGYFSEGKSVHWHFSGKITPDSRIYTLLSNYLDQLELFRIMTPELQHLGYHEDIAMTLLCV